MSAWSPSADLLRSNVRGRVPGRLRVGSQDAAADDPGTSLALTRSWRRKRNNMIVQDALPHQVTARTSPQG